MRLEAHERLAIKFKVAALGRDKSARYLGIFTWNMSGA